MQRNFDNPTINKYTTVARTTGDIVTSTGGRFDPTNYDDFGAAVNDALASLGSRSAVYLPAGPTADFTTDIVISNTDIDIIGQSRNSTTLNYVGDGVAIRLDGSARNNISGMAILGSGRNNNTATGIQLDGRSNAISNASFSNLWISGFGTHAVHEVTDAANIWQCDYSDIIIEDIGSHAFHAERIASGIAERTISRMRSFSQPVHGNFIEDQGAGHFRRFVGCAAEPSVEGIGYNIGGNNFQHISHCKAEGCGGTGFQLQSINKSAVEHCWAMENGNHGFDITSDYRNCWFNDLYTTTNTNTDIRFGDVGTINGNMVGYIPGGYTSVSTSAGPTVDIWDQLSP